MSRKRRLNKHRRRQQGHRGQLPPVNPAQNPLGSPEVPIERCNLSIAPESVIRESQVMRGSPDPALAADRRSPEFERRDSSGDLRSTQCPGQETRPQQSPQFDATDDEPPTTGGSQLNRRPRKLDATAKTRICDLVSFGKTITQAARIVGVTERAVFYARKRDPQFEQQLNESYEDPTLVCAKTMKEFAKEDPKIARDYWKILEPERFDPRITARAEKLTKKMTEGLRRGLSTILTPEQLAQLEQFMNPDRPEQKRRKKP